MPRAPRCFVSSLLCFPAIAGAAVFEVGPGKAYATPNDVAWESIAGGDEVRIHWRAEPYKSKWVICAAGTAAAPIVVRGVPGPEGQLPVISGDGATTRSALNYWGQERSVIKVGGASVPADTTPKHILIENLEVRSGRPPFVFTRTNGVQAAYTNNTAPIWVEKAENLTVRNCILHDSGNGFMVSSGDSLASRNILLESCYIHSNGNVGSIYEHNIYTAAIGMVFQGNRLGPLRAGCGGNNLKDRSAGLVVRYNWIEGGNRQLDLVDGEDSGLIRADPSYSRTHVYGNQLIEGDGDGNRQIVHYGGDSGTTSAYRKGVLHFYHNTVVSRQASKTALFRLSTNDETCEARNNIFLVTAAGPTLALMEDAGQLKLAANWIKPSWKTTHGSSFTGTVTGAATLVTGTDPGFANVVANDFRLRLGSACVDAGGALHADAAQLPVERQYVPHQRTESRAQLGAADLGALELRLKEAWRWQSFGEDFLVDAIASDEADPDGDGISNFVEFAGASDPEDGGSRTGAVPLLVEQDGAVHAGIRFHRILDAGIGYLVQWSPDLASWINGIHYPDADPALAVTGMIEHAVSPDEVEVRTTATLDLSPLYLRVVHLQE